MPEITVKPEPGPLASNAMRSVADLRARAELQPLWKAVRFAQTELVRTASELCQIPAPTFHEDERARRVAQYIEIHTGQKAQSDEIGNRWIMLRGSRGAGPRILVAAHLDTVFPEGTDCSVHIEKNRVSGPGIGDNCSGLSILLTAVRMLTEAGLPFRGELIAAFTVGEEGLGNLRGIQSLCRRFEHDLSAMLALDGGLGQIVGGAVGSARFRVTVKGAGGHSWSDFGRPSAVHYLAQVAAAVSRMDVPAIPRSSFNIGVIKGGTSVNTIAADAELLLDLRSIDPATLAALELQAQRLACSVPLPNELSLDIEKIGERPGGGSKLTTPWVDVARATWSSMDVTTRVTVSSTDANVPLSMGVPASTLGTCRGGCVHTTSEWIDPSSLPLGLEGFLLCVLTGLDVFPEPHGAWPL